MPKFNVLITDIAWPDLSIEREILARVGAEITIAERHDVASLKALAPPMDAIMTNWVKVPGEVIAAAPKCQIVSRLGIGLDNIDVAYCTEHNIPVTNVPDYCVIEVAEHALALLLAMSRKIVFFDRQAQRGVYQLQAGPPLRRLEGQTLGIVGFGNIGRRLAAKALGLGLRVLATSRSRRDPMPGAEFVDLDRLLAESDYVSLNVPATPETKHLMNAERLARMKPSAYLINTARGAVIDEPALAKALERGQLAGAALDVQTQEPPDLTQPPFNDPRVIVTPHAAFVSEESIADLRRRAAEQVAARLSGNTPLHVVNPSVLA
jgi:D-3-phosphoglycerate dehydrogenase